MIKSRANQGYLLLEVLIAVIVILGLTIWWVKSEVHNSQKDEAKVMNQQISAILNAASNYYESTPAVQGSWPDNIDITTLINSKYLLKDDANNPFGVAYTLKPNEDDNSLELKTSVTHANSYIAYKAVESLADASVKVSQDPAKDTTLTVRLPQPEGISQANLVKYQGEYYDGQDVAKNKIACPVGYSPEIIITQKDHRYCTLHTTDWGVFWKVHSRVFEDRLGWMPCDKPVQVSLTCQHGEASSH